MMLCSGLSSTLLLAATCSLITSGFISAQPPVPPAISRGRVITFDSLSVQRLSCERGVIAVQSAVYRCADTQTCSQTGTQDIKNRCDGRKVCDINMNIISASDPGICTYLDTTYTCVSAIHSVTCEGSQANLQCGEGQVIVVYWANYGRRDNTTCSHARPVDQLQNVTCSSPSSTEYATKRCNWQNNCTVEASKTGFGDPCRGTYKYLEVFYACQDHAAAPSCPPGWTWFGGRCFIFNSSMKTWTDAESSCKTLGGHLASYHSTAEYTFIRELTRTAAGSYPRAWVGGKKTETVWMWSDGSQFDFTNWGSGQPDNSGGREDCMEINSDGRDFVDDVRCGSQNRFVCVRGP